MGRKVAKFGGSSLADAGQFEKVRGILNKDAERVLVVVSAPGKRFDKDEKVTDLLYSVHRLHAAGEDFGVAFDAVCERYLSIAKDLNLKVDIGAELVNIKQNIQNGASKDYCASRGEYLNGLLMADYLGFEFIDPQSCIFFDEKGAFDADKTQEVLSVILKNVEKAVVPGFYGALKNGEVHTFSRGGSDITGAIVARAAFAEAYENWTDVSGFMVADPRIVKEPLAIESITYRELRELSYMGATVLHEDAVFPVHRAGIPTHIKNTNCPDARGTVIKYTAKDDMPKHTITGIAGKRGFSIISIEKAMMNAELGFGRRVLEAVEKEGISFEHLPTGIDTMCVVVQREALEGKQDKVVSNIMQMCNPDTVTIHNDLAIIATVGRGMVHNYGTAARVFSAMSNAGVNIRMIDQGSSEISIIVGVDDADFKKTIRAIYTEFVK